MPSSKSSLSEEQIFADIMEMISSSNKKSKNVKNNKNSKKNNSKKNMRGGMAPFGDSEVDMLSNLASFNQEMNNSPNQPGTEMGIDVDSQGVQTDRGNNGEALFSTGNNSDSKPCDAMQGGKPKKRVKKSGVKKSGVKKAVAKKAGVKKVVKKSVAKKVVKKAVAKKVVKKVVKKSATKKPVKKSATKKPVKKVAKKSKTAKK